MTPEQIERIKQLVADLSDEADLCRSETCDDFANLLWRAMDAIEFLLIRAQAARAEQGGWISVEDRLPEMACDVIVAWSNGYVYCASYTFIDAGEELKWDVPLTHNRITHWQHLPKPPKGDPA